MPNCWKETVEVVDPIPTEYHCDSGEDDAALRITPSRGGESITAVSVTSG
jgi:hypothetical protein